jgi:hypothetical protein
MFVSTQSIPEMPCPAPIEGRMISDASEGSESSLEIRCDRLPSNLESIDSTSRDRVPACGQGIARGAPGARPAHSPVARTRLHFNFQLRRRIEKKKRREESMLSRSNRSKV